MSLLTPNPDRGSITIRVPEYIGTVYAWTGTPGQSTSTKSVDGDVVATNLCPTPSFEHGLGSWVQQGSAALSLETAEPIAGTRSMRWERTGSSGSAYAQIEGYPLPGVGETVYLRFRVRPEFTGTMRSLFGTNGLGQYGVFDVPVEAGIEQTVDLEYQTTTGMPAAMRCWIGQGGSIGLTGDAAVIDQVQIAYGTPPGPYFDGDTPDDIEISFAGPSALWVSRQDINGEQVVRTLPGAPSTVPLTVEDYEHALTGPVKYYVNANLAVPYLLGTVDAGQVDWDASWLTVPIRPALSTPVGLVTGYSAELESRTVVHDIIGRPDPLPIIGPLGKRRGQLTYWLADYAGVRAVRQMYARGLVTMLRQPEPGLDLFHVLGDDRIIEEPHELREGMPTRWSITVPFVEVERPTGSKQGSLGWSFDDLATTLSSFDLVTGTFGTFYDLETGPTT